MQRSKIIKDLIMDKINILQALESLDLMLEDAKDSKIEEWVKNELNGYKDEKDIPDYRKVKSILIADVQVGYNLFKNIEIPVSDNKANDVINNINILEPVSKIVQYAKAEDEQENHSLCLDTNSAVINQCNFVNGQVIRASRKLGVYTFHNILAVIKDKLIQIFRELEKNYGNLDDLYIDFSDNEKKDIILNSIFTNVQNDSITIGNNNEIKGSNIGDNND